MKPMKIPFSNFTICDHLDSSSGCACSETDLGGFLCDFIVFEIWSTCYSTFVKNWDDEPDSETLTSDTREPVS